jgi:hypothetical protein
MHIVPRLAVGVIALALAAAGCGGNQITVQEAPGGPAQLEVPGDGAALNPAATPTPTPTVDAAATPTPEAGASSTDQGATEEQPAEPAPEGTDGGGTEAPAGDDSAATDQPPPAGSGAEQFEDFCTQNPGAC